ncbi:MAG TPA: hypothetical protein EYO73_12185 [Sulfurimonas sp.]|nr:hypothetical protein [Sulfurimonas sp.]
MKISGISVAKKPAREYNTDIVLVDIISFTTLTSVQQLELIEYMTQSFTRMLEKLLSNSDMKLSQMVLGFISTGDGFYCILNPRMKGFGTILGLSFNHFSELISQKLPYFKGIRIAVHTGRVYEFIDILGHPNYIGDGLNHCARYLEHKDYTISTVFISTTAYASFKTFLVLFPDFEALLLEQEFKRSGLQKFKDKHDNIWAGYLVWLRKGSLISPPKLKLNSLSIYKD